MSDNTCGNRPPDANADRSQMRLQCIGSFQAHAQDGKAHTIEIWTHFGAVHDRDVARVAPSQLILTTTEGYGVERVDQGEYRLTETPEISLSTDDPSAP